MNILLVEPDYYSRFPPLGLLKLATYHRMKGDDVDLVRGEKELKTRPDRIYVTSLFTYEWKPVHDVVKYYKRQFPSVDLWLGGIYASLMPEHARLSGADNVHKGLFTQAEDLMPAYDMIPEWDGSIIFSSRGCIRKCRFCAVPKLEGEMNRCKYSIKNFVYPSHTRIIIWDNNILASANWKAIFDELIEFGLTIDFNQGLDARLISEKVAERLSQMKLKFIRIAYDTQKAGPSVKRAIEILHQYGIRKKKIIIYALFNFEDDPEDFFQRVRDILNWGAACYPMRFEPLDSLEKNKHVGPNWTRGQLDMVQRARRVLGFSGALPPYEALVIKFNKAGCFDKAFELRPIISKKLVFNHIYGSRNILGCSEKSTRKIKLRCIREKDWRNVVHSSKRSIT